MRVLTVPIMEGIDGEEEDKMSTTTDSVDTSNNDKQSKLLIEIKEKRMNVKELNVIKNEKSLLTDKHDINNNNKNINDKKNEIGIENKNEIQIIKEKVIPSNHSFATSSDTTDKTYHESENFSIILDANNVESSPVRMASFINKTNTLNKNNNILENFSQVDDKIDNLLKEKFTNKERKETNPRDELILSFATAILKSGSRTIDSQNDNKSNIEFHANSSSECSRTNSQVHSASGIIFITN